VDAIAAEVEALTIDARRAASAGAIGDSPDRSGSIVAKPLETLAARTAPSASATSVAIDGPGWFIVESAGHRCYTRLGDFRFDGHGTLVDSQGRIVLGLSLSSGDVAPIRRRGAQGASIDTSGVVSVDNARGREVAGRIALAIFPAPEHLRRIDGTSVRATSESGPPRIAAPGTPNIGTLKTYALENGLVDVAGDLEGMWRLQLRGETQAAAAAAGDSCERAALGLVR
jgi:flagellar hook protein FlgE